MRHVGNWPVRSKTELGFKIEWDGGLFPLQAMSYRFALEGPTRPKQR